MNDVQCIGWLSQPLATIQSSYYRAVLTTGRAADSHISAAVLPTSLKRPGTVLYCTMLYCTLHSLPININIKLDQSNRANKANSMNSENNVAAPQTIQNSCDSSRNQEWSESDRNDPPSHGEYYGYLLSTVIVIWYILIYKLLSL